MEYYDIGAIKKQLIDWHLARDIVNSWLLYVTSTLVRKKIFIVIAVVVSLANSSLVDRHENPYEIACMMNTEAVCRCEISMKRKIFGKCFPPRFGNY